MVYKNYESLFDIFNAVSDGTYEQEIIWVAIGKYKCRTSITYTFNNTIDFGYNGIDILADHFSGNDGIESLPLSLFKNNVDIEKYELYIDDGFDKYYYKEDFDDKHEAIKFLLNKVWTNVIQVVGIVYIESKETFTMYDVRTKNEYNLLNQSYEYVKNVISRRIEENKPINKIKRFFGF